jgi:hypothetical protein
MIKQARRAVRWLDNTLGLWWGLETIGWMKNLRQGVLLTGDWLICHATSWDVMTVSTFLEISIGSVASDGGSMYGGNNGRPNHGDGRKGVWLPLRRKWARGSQGELQRSKAVAV